MFNLSTPCRQAARAAAPMLLGPTLDPHAGSHQTTVAYLADVARAVNTLQEQQVAPTGRVVGVEAAQRALADGTADAVQELIT
eukprot:5317289-Alexandrium_andersonii.AAC.1